MGDQVIGDKKDMDWPEFFYRYATSLGIDPNGDRAALRLRRARCVRPARRPRSPGQNGCAERLIGSIRRDCLDHVVVFGERHLRHLLKSYQKYYNEARTHLSLRADPACRPARRSDVGCANFGRTAPPIYPSVSFRQGQPIGDSTALLVGESQSFLDNVIAQFAGDRAWNDRPQLQPVERTRAAPARR